MSKMILAFIGSILMLVGIIIVFFLPGPFIFGLPFAMPGAILLGVGFLYPGKVSNKSILRWLFIFLLVWGIIFIILDIPAFISPMLPDYLDNLIGYKNGYFWTFGMIAYEIIFGVYLLPILNESKKFHISIICFAFGAAILTIIYLYIFPPSIYAIYTPQILDFEKITFIFSIVAFSLIVIWLNKQRSKEKSITQEAAKMEKSLLEEKLMNAASLYTRIPYKKLAKVLNCKTDDLLDLLTDLVKNKTLQAKIEEPDVIFGG